MNLRAWISVLLPIPLRERLRAALSDYRDIRQLRQYCQTPSTPPPHIVKVRTVLQHARKYSTKILVETGTFEGEMVRKCSLDFACIWTIELDDNLARRAKKRFSRFPHIHVIHGDSSDSLPRVLTDIREPALFWLDGHFSGGVTAKGKKDTPLLEELESIISHDIKGHVILIDDARMLGTGDYPKIEAIEELLKRTDTPYTISVSEDIVRCTPQIAAGQART